MKYFVLKQENDREETFLHLMDKNGTVRYISIGNAEGNLDKLAIEIKKLLEE